MTEEMFTPSETIKNLVAEKEELSKELKEARRKQNELDMNYQFSENKRVNDYQNYKTMLDSIRYPDISVNIKIDKEFQSIIPSMTDDEFRALEDNIVKEGCRDPLVCWKTEGGESILIGGHNRYQICKKHDIAYSVVQKHFTSRAEVINWIIDDQIGRRNLTQEQKTYLIGKKYLEEKKQGDRTDLDGTCGQNVHKLKTSEKIAEQCKINEKTVRRASDYASAVDDITANVDDDFRSKVLNRKVKASQSDVIKLAKMPAEEQKEIVEEIKSGSSLAESFKKRIDEDFILGPIDKELAEIEQKCSGLTELVSEFTKTIKGYDNKDKEFLSALEAMHELHDALCLAITTYGKREQSCLFDAA